MDKFPALLKAFLLYLSLFSRSVFSETLTKSPEICPKHQGTDPNNVNARVQKFAGKDIYYVEDDEYKYKIEICHNSQESVAVQQLGKKWKTSSWLTIGKYDGAHVTGGTNWIMIKYFHGEPYHSHCKDVERISIVLVTCDPGEQRGSIKILEEYSNSTKDSKGNTVPLECYYLFELNHDAACSVKEKRLSPCFIMLITLIVLGVVSFLLCFLYQRCGAKRLERIPNHDFSRDFGSVQVDRCKVCLCWCSEACPTRYKTVDGALVDDDIDDTLLPV